MTHTSVALEMPVEFINITEINPLISKCQIKVCYVSDKPNRNKSIITKEVAREMANSLPGSPIVGKYYNNKEDFGEHDRQIEISNGQFKINDITKPYGFVDLNAKCWFQKFLDDGQYEREYLVTEGYLWTGQYPECQRIIEEGNNQSMELDEKTLDATWTKDYNGKHQFFIINEAIISKLCILGEDCEPCFEGSTITKVQYSFDDNFNQKLYSMMKELTDLLKEGGTSMPNTSNEDVIVEENLENTEAVTEEVIEEVKEELEETVEAQVENAEEAVTEDVVETSEPEEPVAPTYSLEEIPEYVELSNNYSSLQNDYEVLKTNYANMENELVELRAFKASIDKEKKQAMIDSFYMLSDEDKEDVVNNIDTYSLEDIESKLAVACFRNKVSFETPNEEDAPETANTVFNLNSIEVEEESVPGWIKAVANVAKEMK